MHFHLTRVSHNAKTGPIPVSITSGESCPPSCPLKGKGCYAEAGPLAMHWRRVTEGARSISWDIFLTAIKSLPRNQLWRHNQAGDLPGHGERIDAGMMAQLVQANRGKSGFTYTHKHNDVSNLPVIKHANANGFTVNLSANNLEHADKLKALNVGPVVTILPTESTRNHKTPGGNQVIICPATYRDNVSCLTCQLCQKADRKVIVGFPAHGTRKKTASAVSLAS